MSGEVEITFVCDLKYCINTNCLIIYKQLSWEKDYFTQNNITKHNIIA